MFTKLSKHFEFRHFRPHYLDIDTIFGDWGVNRIVRNTIFRKAPPSVVSGYGKRSINLNKVITTFENHIFLSQTDLTRTGIISNSYNEMFEAWRMGPRCSSAETQVCHMSYIIAATITVADVQLKKMGQDIDH